MLSTKTKSRILITLEGGTIQVIDGIPENIVVETRDFDRDGERGHPAWSDEHQAFVREWEAEPMATVPDRAVGGSRRTYHHLPSTDGCDSTFDILEDGGNYLANVPFWDGEAAAESTARRIADALNAQAAVLGQTAPLGEGRVGQGWQIAVIWDIEDVQSIRPDLDDEQAWEVLQSAEKHRDASIGLNWDVFGCHAEMLFGDAPVISDGEGE